MNLFLAYILKVVLASASFFAYYLLALRNKNFHPYNRFYLLSTAVLSTLLPLLHISMFDFSSDNERMLALFQLLGSSRLPDIVVGVDNPSIQWEQIGLLASLSITFIILTVISIRIIKVFKLRSRYPKKIVDHVHFINTDIEQAPFSFLNNLFWRKDILLSDKVGEQIYRHEMAHIQQKHSVDKILFQVLRAIFWMNPIYYYMQKELLLIHEFMADQKAVEQGDSEAFARMLLATQFGGFQFEPAHSLSYSSIKKRLHMITNSHTPKYSYLRRLLFLPLLFTVSFVFALRAHRLDIKEQTANLEAMVAQQASSQTSKADKMSKNDNIMIVNTHDSTDQPPLYILDGQEITDKEMKALSPDQIKAIRVFKGEKAIEKFGEKGKNGVIVITSKTAKDKAEAGGSSTELVVKGYKTETNDSAKQATSAPISSQLKGKVKGITVVGHKSDSTGKHTIHIKGSATGGSPLILFDGKQISQEQMDAIAPEDIKSISILKDESATKQYGDKGKDGVIIIVSKTGAKNAIQLKANSTSPKLSYRLADSTIAQYPGGLDAWKQYLEGNLNEKVPVSNKAPKGRYAVVVGFTIDKEGNTHDFKVEQKAHKDYGTAAEALRVLKESGHWTPATHNGQAVASQMRQKIIFQVNQQPKAAQ